MDNKELIKRVVSLGGSVTFPYKDSYEDWIDTAKIFRICSLESTQYYVHCPLYQAFFDLDAAVDCFCEHVLSPKNLALAWEGIRRHKLSQVELDDLPEEEIRRLVKLYNEQYFAKDYRPIVETKAGPAKSFVRFSMG